MFILGVNGGGTKTRALVFNSISGNISEGTAGPSNYHNIGINVAYRNIRLAMKRAGVVHADVACFALAGIDTDYDKHMMERRLKRLAGRVVIVQDGFAELYSETHGGKGVLVISGTGSVVLGYNGRKVYRAAGSGWLLGDEGSGYWIGRKSLRTVFRILNSESKQTTLSKSIMKYIGASNLDDLVRFAYSTGNTVHKVAELETACDNAAQLGDKAAIGILKMGAELLAGYAYEIAKKIGVRHVFISGGVFKSKIYSSSFSSFLSRHGIKTEWAGKPLPLGALYIAAKLSKIEIDKKALQKYVSVAANVQMAH